MHQDLGLGRWRNTDEDLIPPMMFARGGFSVSGKALLQHFAVSHFRHIYQTPTRKPTAALPSHLITK